MSESRTSLRWFLLIALTLLVGAIALELAILLIRTVGDIGWCYENYAPTAYNQLRCLVVEGRVTGRFFYPGWESNLPW